MANPLKHLLVLGVIVMLLIPVYHTMAIDVAVPSDFPAYECFDYDQSNQGYYLVAGKNIQTFLTDRRGYLAVVDARGDLVWFHAEDEYEFYCHQTEGRLHPIQRDIDALNKPSDVRLLVFDDGFQPADTVFQENPHMPSLNLNLHEAQVNADGSKVLHFTEWQTVDMSQWVNGGDPEAQVMFDVIQVWDVDDNLLWHWHAGDHLDELPFTGMTQPVEYLQQSRFEHMHMNSIQVTAEGDYIISARNWDAVMAIDGDDGTIEWILGGTQNDFEITTGLDLPVGVPLDFSRQHEASFSPDGHVLLYDNGRLHNPMRAYGREYQLDFDTMTADLVWVVTHPDHFGSLGSGSIQIVEDNKRFICWGAGPDLTMNASEMTYEGDLVWEIKIYRNPQGTGGRANLYRAYKWSEQPVSSTPYLISVPHYAPPSSSIELVANWFGHEDEVAGFKVYAGGSADDLTLVGTTTSGIYTLTGVNPLTAFFCQVLPVDGSGQAVGPPSNLIETAVARTCVVLEPVGNLDLPDEGGTITYDLTVVSIADEEVTLHYTQVARYPDGSSVAVHDTDLTMAPHSYYQQHGETYLVPPEAPGGEYVMEGELSEQDGWVLYTDEFEFTKSGVGVDDTHNSDGLAHPGAVSMESWPNPFNDRVGLTVRLQAPSPVRIEVFDITGRQVATLLDGHLPAGSHRLSWEARGVAAGVYLVKMSSTAGNRVSKITLLK